MELWIRSQDKMTLEKCERLNVYKNDGTVEGWYISNGNFFAGNYISKSRALEVLDEIQKHIEDILNYDHMENKVYEMPQE